MTATYAELGKTSFAVIDIESTGFNSVGVDRIVEIAVIRLNSKAEIEDEYVTLVNPRRDIGPSYIHGITAAEVLNAPTFKEIAGDVASRLSNAIIVGHNVRFDLGFIAAEFGRTGTVVPDMPTLCTLKLAQNFSDEIASRKLRHCCEAAGITLDDEHSALADARATAHLLAYYLEQARSAGYRQLAEMDCTTTILPTPGWCPFPPSGAAVGRELAKKQNAEERTYLARLVERMLGDEAKTPREAEYLSLLDRALEDRRITREEAKQLIEQATNYGMSRAEVLDAHRAYLASLCSEALVDGIVTGAERRDLETVCDMLDLNRAALEEQLAAPSPAQRFQTECLQGKTVCFTGELLGLLDGERITRKTAEAMAVQAGLEVLPNVTRRLDILVVADPHTQSGKAEKARQYGTRVLAETAFWKAIGAKIE